MRVLELVPILALLRKCVYTQNEVVNVNNAILWFLSGKPFAIIYLILSARIGCCRPIGFGKILNLKECIILNHTFLT